MKQLTFKQLRRANVARCESVFHSITDWSPTDWACALAGESGEFCNTIKKYRRLDGADADLDTLKHRQELVEDAGKELADVVIYADLCAARFGLSLEQLVRNKFNEVSKRRQASQRL